MGRAHPVEDPLVGHQRPGPESAREHHDVRCGQLLEGRVDLDTEHPVVRSHDAALVTDERHVEVRDALQHLVGADPVERREVGEQGDRDAGHVVTVVGRRAAGSVGPWTYASE